MPTPHSFIIIKGQPKALQIENISLEMRGVFAVKFKNSPTTFHYRYNDVVWLRDAVWHDHLHCKVFVGGREQLNVENILSFEHGGQTHWRITYGNGHVQDYLHGCVHVVESCLADGVAKNTFEFLKRVAQTNELGKDEEHGGILPALYEKIDFIDEDLAAATYLAPHKRKVCRRLVPNLVFPFGSNSSQEKAVTAAFENQVSVIQGPPGTGKTQTILNIIANLLIQGKSVIVVSNNNSATQNVLEKLQGYGLDFLVASLGKRENKEDFINNQPAFPVSLQTWGLPAEEAAWDRRNVADTLLQLQRVYELQEKLASARQELKAIELEWEHFKQANQIGDETYVPKWKVKSSRLMNLWLHYQAYAEGNCHANVSGFGKLMERLRWMWLNFTRRYRLGIKSPLSRGNLLSTIMELQALYYIVRIRELTAFIGDATQQLSAIDAKALQKRLTTHSMKVLKHALYERYHNGQRRIYDAVGEIRLYAGEFVTQYPVVLSTTFSARTSIPEMVYDYLIMDEASQVSIETGALALTCAKNAIIVGDSLQLPNVVTKEDKLKLDAIFQEFDVAQGYDCGAYSFLQSVCAVIPSVRQTLLREHYRCHPKIINFCNQRFYGGNLLVMTEDKDEENVLTAIRISPGHHTRGHYNQREIDVVRQEILPKLNADDDIGIITPYNHQVDEFNRQLPGVETATIHKFQGREKDTIIMSVVDDEISEFADDPNLLNVAISRAKQHFCLVVSGNDQERKGNVMELMDYIAYNNFVVADSGINSIFDYLYSQYTSERMSFLAGHRHISEYDSENLTFSLIEDILHDYPEYSHLGVLCHTPIRTVVRDLSMLSEDEIRYISHYSTHLDFLIFNHVTKKPVLAIETDGYSYHHSGTEQHLRDVMKNHILEIYGLPLLRLSTTGSGEKGKIVDTLNDIISLPKKR